MYGCCARSRCSPSRPIISTLRLSSSLLSSPPCLPRPTSISTSSMTSRINGKSGLLNDRSRDTRIVRAGHATSASKTFLPASSPLPPLFTPRRFSACARSLLRRAPFFLHAIESPAMFLSARLLAVVSGSFGSGALALMARCGYDKKYRPSG